nr:MAG TPA: Protein of unknown function (DUF1366) [Caudoviricetes sp.]
MTFKIINKYLQENNRTFVAIRQENPYTAFDRVLVGNRVDESDEELIKAVIGQVTTEFNPADQGETLEQLATLEQNGKLGIWKWTEPKQEKPSSELETQPVQ